MNWTAKERAGKPVVGCYCASFLKRDMQHVHRQIVNLPDVAPYVITQKRENADLFWFPDDYVDLHRKPRTRFFRRLWYQQIRDVPWEIYSGEVRQLLYTMLRRETDLVHIYFGNVAMRLLPLIKACPRPVVVSFHGADVAVDMEKPAYRRKMREVLDRATLVLARSHALLGDLEALGCPPEKLRLHRAGVPLHRRLEFLERDLPRAPDGSWRFIQACRMIEKKGIRTTLRAFAAICERYPEARLTLAGDGPEKESLQEFAAELGISSQVEFPGFQDADALWELYRAAHVFFHPSETGPDGNREGVPNAMLEAMATGMPVLATRHGGIPEAIEDGVSGILVEEGDWRGLADRALEMLEEEARYRGMAAAGRAKVEKEFNISRQILRLQELYREGLARASRAVNG